MRRMAPKELPYFRLLCGDRVRAQLFLSAAGLDVYFWHGRPGRYSEKAHNSNSVYLSWSSGDVGLKYWQLLQ